MATNGIQHRYHVVTRSQWTMATSTHLRRLCHVLAFARPGHTTSHVTNGAWWAIMECTPPQRRGPRVTEKRPNTALGAGALEHVCSARTVKMTAAQFQHKCHGNTTLACQMSLTQFPKWIQQIHSQISKPRFARKIPTQVGPCFPRSSNLTELAVQ